MLSATQQASSWLMKFLILKPFPLPILIPFGLKYSSLDPVSKSLSLPYREVISRISQKS